MSKFRLTKYNYKKSHFVSKLSIDTARTGISISACTIFFYTFLHVSGRYFVRADQFLYVNYVLQYVNGHAGLYRHDRHGNNSVV